MERVGAWATSGAGTWVLGRRVLGSSGSLN